MEIEITSFSKKGWGCGQTEEGTPVEVPGTIPGDRITVELGRRKRRGYRAQINQWLEKAPNRIEPRCQHFAECGGCRWQPLDYPDQLRQKQESIEALFDADVRPILPAPSIWHYRNKMEFSFSSDRAGNRFLGLCMAGGRGRVVSLDECYIAPKWMMETLHEVRHWWAESGLAAYHPPSDTGSLINLTCREGRRTGDRIVILTVQGEIESPPNLPSLLLRHRHAEKGKATYYTEQLISGKGFIEEKLGDLTFRISPSAFFQPNSEAAEQLYRQVIEIGEIGPQMSVYDLYCGTGTLGLFAAPLAKKVVGVELVEEAIADARLNAEASGIDNIEFHVGDVAKILQTLPMPDLVLLDPPRAGLGEKVVQQLLEFSPERIVYVSCNPKSQAVDVAQLVDGGYRLKTVQPVDQFPHTLHVENIALLIKKS